MPKYVFFRSPLGIFATSPFSLLLFVLLLTLLRVEDCLDLYSIFLLDRLRVGFGAPPDILYLSRFIVLGLSSVAVSSLSTSSSSLKSEDGNEVDSGRGGGETKTD